MNNDILSINQVADCGEVDRSPADNSVQAQDVIENLISRRPLRKQIENPSANLALDIAYKIRDTHLTWSSLI